MDEEIIILEDEIEEIEEIEVEEVAGYSLEAVATRHSDLAGRNDAEQHEISAITGLQAKLDSIEALQTVYSDTRGQADYYKWADGNPNNEDRCGLFVTMFENDDGMNVIKVCDDDEDVFGVTVSVAGFVGGQAYTVLDFGEKIGRDGSYGLVVCSGLAPVRHESTVAVGDYVYPNAQGIARKSEGKYGYFVTALREDENTQVSYADVSLLAPSTFAKHLSKTLYGDADEKYNNPNGLVERMDAVESDVADALSNASVAYTYAQSAYDEIEKIRKNSDETNANSNSTKEEVNETLSDYNDRIESAETTVLEAKAEAQLAAQSAESIKSEAVAKATEIENQLGEFTKTLEPITTWSYIDPVTGKTKQGPQYMVDYIKDDLVTRSDVVAGNTISEEYKSMIERSASQINSVVTKTDKYSVGEHSQAYGLTYEQANNILTTLMVYIPTLATIDEEYGNSDGTTYKQTFNKGYFYTWICDYETVDQWDEQDKDWLKIYYVKNDESFYYYLDGEWHDRYVGNIAESWIPEDEPSTTGMWVPSKDNYVTFSSTVPSGIEGKYWVATSSAIDDATSTTYDLGCLYYFTNNKWIKVATITDNSNSRALSGIYQTANSISMEVSNMAGSVANLQEDVTAQESKIQSLAYHAIGDYVSLDVWNEDIATSGTIYFVANKDATNDADKNLYYYNDGSGWKSTKLAYEAGLEGTMAQIQQKADESGAIISQVVEAVGADGNVTAASITSAIVGDKSSIDMLADKITVDGYVTFTNLKEENNNTVINGGNITTGAIKSAAYKEDESGLKIDLDNGELDSQNFKVKKDGSVSCTGEITATSLKIHNGENAEDIGNVYVQIQGGQVKSDDFTEYTQDEINQENKNQYFAKIGMGIDLKNQHIKATHFGIDAEGCVHAENADISGTINSTNGIFDNCEATNLTVQSGTLEDIETGYIHSSDYEETTSEKEIIETHDIIVRSATLGTMAQSDNQEYYYPVTISGEIELNTIGDFEHVSQDISGDVTYEWCGNIYTKNKENCSFTPTIDEKNQRKINYTLTFDTTTMEYDKIVSNQPQNFSFSIRVSLKKTIITSTVGSAIVLGVNDSSYITFPNFNVNETGDIIASSGIIGGMILGKKNVIRPLTAKKNQKTFLTTGDIGQTDGNGETMYSATATVEFNEGDIKHVVVQEEPDNSYYTYVEVESNNKYTINLYSTKKLTQHIVVATIEYYTKETEATTEAYFGTADESFQVVTDDKLQSSVFCNNLSLNDINTTNLQTSRLIATNAIIGGLSVNNGSLSCGGTNVSFGYGGTDISYNANVTESSGEFVIITDKSLKFDKEFKIVYEYVTGSKKHYDSVVMKAGKNRATIKYNGMRAVQWVKFLDDQDNKVSTLEFKQGSNRYMSLNASFVPTEAGYDLGTSSTPWSSIYSSEIYSSNGTVKTSDKNKKNTITYLSEDSGTASLFDELKPATFKLNSGTSDRLHYGFIAQDIKNSLDKLNIDTKDFAAYCEWEESDADGNKVVSCGIRDSELISLCVHEIQKLKKQVATLESKLSTQQND